MQHTQMGEEGEKKKVRKHYFTQLLISVTTLQIVLK